MRRSLTVLVLIVFVWAVPTIAAVQITPANYDWAQAFAEARRSPGFSVESVDDFREITEYYNALVGDGVVVHELDLETGEHVQCVDVTTQRSLAASEAPLQIQPGMLPAAESGEIDSSPSDPAPRFGLDGTTDSLGRRRECPQGSFPRLIPALENFYHFKRLEDLLRKSPTGSSGFLDPGPSAGSVMSTATIDHEYAHAYQAVNHIGISADFNVWSPSVELSTEFSLSQLWVTRGSTSDNSLQTVEAGWQAYPWLYGGSQSRLFLYYTTGNYQSGTGCYNLMCSGFVQTNSSVVLGGSFSNYSTLGGTQYAATLAVFRDPAAPHHWWIRYGTDTWVGYYPNTLFDSAGIASYSDRVDVGGEIINEWSGARHTETDMGSGRFPSDGFGYSAYTKKIQYWSPANSLFDATSLSRSVTNAAYYDLSLKSSTDTAWRRYFYFGGPGNSSTIRVTSPNGGESWAIGSPHTITWTSSGLNQSGQIYVLLSRDGGQSEYPTPIAILSPVSTSYSWTPSAGHATTAGRIFVGNLVGGAYQSSDWSDQNFTIGSAAPANDNCANATVLTSSASCNYTSGTVLNATPSGLAKPSCDAVSSPNMFDVWYRFNAVSASQTVTVVPATGTGDPVVSAYGSCSGSAIGCADSGGQGGGETLQLTGLTVGATYYIRVYDYGTVEPLGADANFQICVTAQVTNYTLTVTGGGSGQGTVTGNGINCTISSGSASGTCSASYASGTDVPLTASPTGGSTFSGWGGMCGGTGGCTVTMSANRSVSASFTAPVSNYTLTVSGGGTGQGTVSGTGINCTISSGGASGACSAIYASGTNVALTATPTGGSTFSGWGGMCAGAGGCTVTMSANRSVSASFNAPTAAQGYYAITPCRLIDTRSSSQLAAYATRNVTVAGNCGIPSAAMAVSLNVTVVSPLSNGWLTVFAGPSTAPRPATSTVSYRTARTRANNTIAAVGSDGTVNVYNGGSIPVDFIVDVTGFFR